jgi:hypothetical protein
MGQSGEAHERISRCGKGLRHDGLALPAYQSIGIFYAGRWEVFIQKDCALQLVYLEQVPQWFKSMVSFE